MDKIFEYSFYQRKYVSIVGVQIKIYDGIIDSKKNLNHNWDTITHLRWLEPDNSISSSVNKYADYLQA